MTQEISMVASGGLTRLSPSDLHREAKAAGWFHSIDLGGGHWTDGHKSPERMEAELAAWQFPMDLTGKTVLDIGCADGGWSVAAIRRGARSVLSIDAQMTSGMQFLLNAKLFPFKYEQIDLFSKEFMVLPKFDVIIFAGVLYHVQDPLEALKRVRSKAGELVILETHINERLGTSIPYMVYYEADELGKDPTNWWGPNTLCLEAILRTAGFRATKIFLETENESNSRICYHLQPLEGSAYSKIIGLPAAARVEPTSTPLNGYIDICTANLIGGWAWDADHPERRLGVEISVDGEPLAQVNAQAYREDLKNAGIGDGTYAFWYTPLSPIDPENQSVSAVVVGTDTFLRRSQPTSAATGGGIVPLDWPPIQVEIDADDSELQSMHGRINRTWSHLGSVQPYWSVLAHPLFRTECFPYHKENFFETGDGNVKEFLAFARRSDIGISSNQVCFELGCGVGRVTGWLSRIFSRVVAADISAAHLQIAQAVLTQREIQNVSLLHLEQLRDLEKLDPFDVFFSVIVLQHNPPPIIAYMLRTILAKLNRGGIGYFQIPSYSKGYVFNVQQYLSQVQEGQDMEMHVLPQKDVIDIIYTCDCQLLELREDKWTGDAVGVSNTFLVRKSD